MRLGMVLIIAGVLLFVVTLPNSVWLTRGQNIESTTRTVVNNVLVSNTKTSTAKYELADINTLVLETFSGNIEVEVSDTMSSLGEFEIKQQGNTQQKAPTLERQGNVLVLKATQSNNCDNCGVGYKVQLGKAMRLELRNQNGEIVVNGLSNSIKANSTNGSITIMGTGKTTLDLETSNGNITLENIALVASSQNKIRSENGNITLTQLENGTGVGFRGAVVNGSLNLNLEGLNFSQRQDREFRASLNGDNPAQLELYNQNGDITLE